MKKAPRHYAAEIVELKTREERIAALEQVPDNMRGLVKLHVEIEFKKRKQGISKSIEI
mgnify:FL=1